jgi:L-alanine-DL-glutamate epimerase-like enolase superfamily enzyme
VNPNDIHIDDFSFAYEEFLFRTPLKFGGTPVDRSTLVNVTCHVSTAAGRTARGFGSMPLGNVWSFPSRLLSYNDTLGAMLSLVEHITRIYASCKDSGHPIDLTWALEPAIHTAAHTVTRELALAEPVPILCALVVASAFDAALHDAYGKVHGLNCYHTYGPDFLAHDLGHYLGAEFRGDRLDQFLTRDPVPRMPLYHLIGALDPIEPGDVRQPIGDGLPETLGDWIAADGLTHLKIKLNGDDLDWDVARVLKIERAAAQAQQKRGVDRWVYSLDFNERCANVDYLLTFLERVRAGSASAFERVQYIEQPTARDLKANRHNVMHAASKVRPVVIDESLLDLESLQIAREMGYTGAALKACKGQTQSLLMAAAAQKYGMFLCVQDLTCPGASLIHSAGLAAHVRGVAAIESNARQFMPAANAPWVPRLPTFFRVTNGTVDTSVLSGLGLGAV